jgi:hypothetical protein
MPKNSDFSDRRKKEELCCCGPMLRVHGQVEGKTKAVGAKIDLSESAYLRALANSALSPQQPNAIANGYAETRLDLAYDKPKDCVALTTTYTIYFEVESECGPCEVEIQASGAAVTRQRGLPGKGYIGLSTVRLFTGEDYFNRVPETLAVRAVATDCEGRTHECRMTLVGA